MLTRRAFALSAAARLAANAAQTRNGWILIRLAGTPEEIGFQHGAELFNQIVAGREAIERIIVHDTRRDWKFYREAALSILWPRVEEEYRKELDGIRQGLETKGVDWSIGDVVALNGWMELAWYYVPWLDRQVGEKAAEGAVAPDHCSAFVATGSYTRDGRPVIAHNAWVDYAIGAHWNVIFDIRPAKGHRILMDGYPGLIHSGDDFGINAAGLMITETTISGFQGFDPKGVPEFVRARKAMQYASSIDEFAAAMRDGNNGGYANNWLIADTRRNEIASLELGLKNINLWRTKDGYFAGANFPVHPELIAEETTFDFEDPASSANARRARWTQLMEEHRGRIDVEAAKRFLADSWDAIDRHNNPSERTLCGRIDLSPRGSKPWQPEFGPAGAVQNKAADANMAKDLRFVAAVGPQAGPLFDARAHLAAHPEFQYQAGVLRDLPPEPWTEFRAAR